MKHPASSAQTPNGPPPLDAATEARLDAFQDLLLRWNDRINLIGRTTTETLRQRHIEDCLQLAPLVPDASGPIADLGSGAGLPGLVLAIVTRQEVHLVESDRRKCAFLIEAAARLGLPNIHVHASRIEDVRLPPIATLTARALAPLTGLLQHAHRLLAPGGIAVFPKGRMAERELTDARASWSFQVERFPSHTDAEATIFRLSDIRHAQPQA